MTQAQVGARPLWATALAIFCAASLLFLAYRDLFVPGPRDVEVWFGFEVRGAAARWSAPLHWLLFAVAAWGYWSQKRWTWPWASVYSLYVGVSHMVWNLTSPVGGGVWDGTWQCLLFSLPAVPLWWARPNKEETLGLP